MGRPPNGFDSTVGGSGNCVTTAVFDVGTKVADYNDGTVNPGWYTMCYMQFVEGSDSAYDAGAPSTGYGLCFHCEATQHHPDGNVTQTWYAVTHDLTNSDGSYGGAVALPACDLSGADTTTTGAEYGWFWIGGVCPCVTSPRVDCTRLGGDVLTDGNIVAGSPFYVQDDGTNAAEIALHSGDATKHMLGTIGWSLVVDA
jgi:hypothetical protein